MIERNEASDTLGWGVGCSDQALANLLANVPVSAAALCLRFAYWEDIGVAVGGHVEHSRNHGFIRIAPNQLLLFLQDRARELGTRLKFKTEFEGNIAAYADYDLIVVTYGACSQIRAAHEERFGAGRETRANILMWPVTSQLFAALVWTLCAAVQTGYRGVAAPAAHALRQVHFARQVRREIARLRVRRRGSGRNAIHQRKA